MQKKNNNNNKYEHCWQAEQGSLATRIDPSPSAYFLWHLFIVVAKRDHLGFGCRLPCRLFLVALCSTIGQFTSSSTYALAQYSARVEFSR